MDRELTAVEPVDDYDFPDEGSVLQRCAGCGPVRNTRGGLCKQCTLEREARPAAQSVYEEASLW